MAINDQKNEDSLKNKYYYAIHLQFVELDKCFEFHVSCELAEFFNMVTKTKTKLRSEYGVINTEESWKSDLIE